MTSTLIKNSIKSKLTDAISKSINLKSIGDNILGGKTFQLDLQNKIFGDLQGGLSKLSINDIKTKLDDVIKSKYSLNRESILDEIESNPIKYIDPDDWENLSDLSVRTGKTPRQLISDNMPTPDEVIPSNMDTLARDIKDINFPEIKDPELKTTIDDLRADPEVKNRGIGSNQETDLKTFLDKYKNDIDIKRRARDETPETAKQASKEIVIRDGNTKTKIFGYLLTGSAIAGIALLIWLQNRDQNADIINIKRVDNEKIEIIYNKKLKFCNVDEVYVSIPSDILDQPIDGDFSYEEKSDRSVIINPGFSSQKFPSKEGSYGNINISLSYVNALGCVPGWIKDNITDPLGGNLLDKFFKAIFDFLKKSGLIIGGVILGIIVLYIALKFFVFRSSGDTQIKIVSPVSNARYYYR
jgi:hypothetical protein